MDWIKILRAYKLPSLFIALSLLSPIFILSLKDNYFIAAALNIFPSVFAILLWVPMALFLCGILISFWVTCRLLLSEYGVGSVCPHCGGPLSLIERYVYSSYRKCLKCGKNVNKRHYS